MVLLLREQNCKSHGAFKANVNIEDATSREQPFERFQGAHKRVKTDRKSITWLPGSASRHQI